MQIGKKSPEKIYSGCARQMQTQGFPGQSVLKSKRKTQSSCFQLHRHPQTLPHPHLLHNHSSHPTSNRLCADERCARVRKAQVIQANKPRKCDLQLPLCVSELLEKEAEVTVLSCQVLSSRNVSQILPGDAVRRRCPSQLPLGHLWLLCYKDGSYRRLKTILQYLAPC